MSNERYLICAATFEVGKTSFFIPTSDLLFKEVAQLPEILRNRFHDPYVEVDRQVLYYMGDSIHILRDGSRFLVRECGCGECGRGKEAYATLLELGWLTKKQQFPSE